MLQSNFLCWCNLQTKVQRDQVRNVYKRLRPRS